MITQRTTDDVNGAAPNDDGVAIRPGVSPLTKGGNGECVNEGHDDPVAERDHVEVAAESESAVLSRRRDANGRFIKGHPGGPGNPYARHTARLRWIMSQTMTDDDMRDITRTFIECAKAGDKGAAALLFAYVLGRPTLVQDPDTLDRQEWKLREKAAVNPMDIAHAVYQLPASEANETVERLAPVFARVSRVELLNRIDSLLPDDEGKREQLWGAVRELSDPPGPATSA
jgi:hypothetical protein